MASKASCSHHVPMTMEATKENKSEKYDVFLSHRGPDTKTWFVGFLKEGLKQKGLLPYLDCEAIPFGEDCWKSIEDGIKNSPIAMVVFSERYVESEWCLKELHVMLETHSCKKILPIFYNVEPWDVRNPEKGKFKDGFEKLKKKFDSKVIEEWKANLEVASKLMGWMHSDNPTRSQASLVAEVVERIFVLANKPLPLDVGEHVAGVEEVADKLIQCQVLKEKISVLCLWGMGGIGKSTLAKELYNQLCKEYEASCFVEDVKEKIKQGHGVVEIQKRMLKDLCPSAMENDNKSELKRILEERLCRKRIVVVLDDVDDVEMLDYMMTRKMLKKGSICIVTLRDKRVFEASNIFDSKEQDVYVHKVEMLNLKDSKHVFTSFAFGRDCGTRPKYEELATNISELCCGVPLVLKVYGALLKGEKKLDVWEDVETRLISGGVLDDKKILDCLRLSYDFLEDNEKKMFLDIACGLLGELEDMAICIWRSQGWGASLGVRNLKEKALISVDKEGFFTMHDHLRDMGRKIERVEAGESRRRLWMPMSLSLLNKKEPLPHSLQTLVFTASDPHMVLDLSNMKELRIPICDKTVNLTSIPQNLRCICEFFNSEWPKHPSRQNFPKVPENNHLAFLRWTCMRPTYDLLENFQRLTDLKTLELKFFKDEDILEGSKDEDCYEDEDILDCSVDEDILEFSRGGQKGILDILELNFEKLYVLRDITLWYFNGKTISGFSSKHENLRYLTLLECGSLRSCPIVGDLLALEELDIDGCWKLEELPNLQQLTRLRKLNIQGCKSITSVPGLGNLVALEEFTVWACDSLIALPDVHKLTNLQTLYFGPCYSLEEVPSLCELIALQPLNIYHGALQGGSNLHNLNKLVSLDVRNWSEPVGFSDVASLEHLRIQQSGEGIEMMPNLLNLPILQSVEIRYCSFKDVSCLGNLISLRSISISSCRSLETLPDVHKLTRLETLEVDHCPNVKVWAGVSRSKSLDTLWVDQPRSGTVMALQTLTLEFTNLRELLALSLFPELKELSIRWCRRLEGLISTMPMTALEWLEIKICPELQEVPDLSHCKLLSWCEIYCCKKISLTRDEITKLEAMIPGLKTDFRP